MKKGFALFLAAAMLLSACCAVAETVQVYRATDDFDVTMVIPEGYGMKEERVNSTLMIDVTSEDETLPMYLLTIAFSEEYEGRTLSELTEDEQDELINMMDDEYHHPVVSSQTTKEGTMVFVLDENDSESDYATAFTVYKGYFIQVYIAKPSFDTLSEADVEMAINLLGDMHFVE